MARIFITGSADGLGHLSAKLLLELGHQVVLHARNSERGREAMKKFPGAETVVTGDLSNIEETKKFARAVNESKVVPLKRYILVISFGLHQVKNTGTALRQPQA